MCRNISEKRLNLIWGQSAFLSLLSLNRRIRSWDLRLEITDEWPEEFDQIDYTLFRFEYKCIRKGRWVGACQSQPLQLLLLFDTKFRVGSSLKFGLIKYISCHNFLSNQLNSSKCSLPVDCKPWGWTHQMESLTMHYGNPILQGFTSRYSTFHSANFQDNVSTP